MEIRKSKLVKHGESSDTCVGIYTNRSSAVINCEKEAEKERETQSNSERLNIENERLFIAANKWLCCVSIVC